MQIPFARPMLGAEEKQAVLDAMDSGVLVHGPRLHAFEAAFAAFTGAPHCVAVSSCTAALHLAYFHLGIGPGDEVIVPAMTHTATAHAVELTGAKPVFVDAEPRTGNIDLARIESALTPNTRAISVVHFLGMPVDMDAVMAIARPRGLFVVEDCALSPGAYLHGTHTGLIGDVGCFSFYPAKHMTTAEGGALITRHEEVARAATKQRAFGMDKSFAERKVAGVYDVQGLGFNYRMSEIQAAIGTEQVRRLPEFLDKRRRNHAALTEALREIDGITLFESGGGGFESSHYCHAAILDDGLAEQRPRILERMKELGVGTSVYYPSPVPNMTYYREKYGYADDAFPVAVRISHNSIALPVGPHLEVDDMRTIAGALRTAIADGREG
jgi:dTDP-4-amino-4,6-dideoxygalactose transaminase